MSTCNCPACYGRRGWEPADPFKQDVTVDGVEYETTNYVMHAYPDTSGEPGRIAALARESIADSLVGDVVGTLAMVREPTYGGVRITDDQIKERAAAIVQVLILGYRIERLP